MLPAFSPEITRPAAPASLLRRAVEVVLPESKRARCCERTVSVVIPTYREAANIPALIQGLLGVRSGEVAALDVWIMDDRSNDGIREAVAALGLDWVHLVERDGPRGLSEAVLEGIGRCEGETIVVMDADLSHPPGTIPALLDALDRGAEFAVGSRYVAGGGTGDDWGVLRRLNSSAATALARPLAKLRDPMSGFFAFERDRLRSAGPLSPLGFKIGLELIVKCRAVRITEVPIHFAPRVRGESKLSFVHQAQYIEHIRRLYWFKLMDVIRKVGKTRAPRSADRT
jgi:dolichol-phosphate mannosyltransferase